MAGLFDDLAPASGRSLDPRGRDLAIRTIWGEAANEPEEGQAAVAAVIRNRVKAGRYGGEDVPSVVRAPNQFEPWNTSGGQMRMRSLRSDDPRYEKIGAIVDGIFADQMPDPTNGATHFFAPKAQAALGRNVPAWAQGEGQSIGGHLFFAPEGRVQLAASSSPSPSPSPVVPQNGRQLSSPSPPAAVGLFDDLAAPAAQGDTTGGQFATPSAENFRTAREGVSGPARNIGVGEAIGRGAARGITANFFDELRGLVEAGGANPDDPASLAALIQGAYRKVTGDPEASRRYDTAVARERETNKLAQEQQPGASLGGEIAGAIAVPVGGLLNAATLPARIGRGAAVGAGYGALAGAGEGEGTGDRLTRAATGGAIGGTIGAAAPPVISGVASTVGAGWRATEPVRNALRGQGGVEREAGKRVTQAIETDLRGMGPQAAARLAQMDEARRAGTPVANMDLGGEATRNLARSAADTSAEAATALNKTINERFEGQFGRVANWLNDNFHYPNAAAQQKAIDAAESAANRAGYARAMNSPNAQGLWDEGFAQMTTAPAVQSAIKQAMIQSRNANAREGFAPVKGLFDVDSATGALVPKLAADGQRMLPNLAFWDRTKKNLDGMGGEGRQWSKILRDHLDELVPDYGKARAGAKSFFDAEDALSAGQNFVGLNKNLSQARDAFNKLSDNEKKLFQDGFLSRFMESLGNVSDRRNIIDKINQSPNARAKLEMVLGSGKWRELETRLTVESIMDLPRGAVQGNSKSSRFLYNLTQAGGVGGFGLGSYYSDPTSMASSAFAALLASRGKNVDTRIAKRVGEMLASSDPAVLSKGIAIVSRNPRMLDALRSTERSITKLGGIEGSELVGSSDAGGP